MSTLEAAQAAIRAERDAEDALRGLDYSVATVDQINTVAAILGKARAATDNAVRALGGAA